MIKGSGVERGRNAPSEDNFTSESPQGGLHGLGVAGSLYNKGEYRSAVLADPYGLISRWQMNQGNGSRKDP